MTRKMIHQETKARTRRKLVLDHSTRSAFTLIELMVVVIILAILAALIVGALRGAQQDTLASKTRGTLAKIDAVLNERMDEYLTKQLDFLPDSYLSAALVVTNPPNATSAFLQVENFPVENMRKKPGVERLEDTNWPAQPGRTNPPYTFATVPSIGMLRERVRISATRDLMRMEMPDCVGDLFVGGYVRPLPGAALPVPFVSAYLNSPVALPVGLFQHPIPPSVPAVRHLMRLDAPAAYRRIVQKVWQADQQLSAAGRLRPGGAAERWADSYSNEELLFLIVEDSYVDGAAAIENFAASEIGDVDADGLHEFLDAWGVPIRWMRWPAGVQSVAPMNPDPLDVSGSIGTDPLDPTYADIGYDYANTGVPNAASGEGMQPLVISAGPDGRFGRRFYAIDPSSVNAASPIASPIYSPANVGLTLVSTPRRPGYWGTNPFNWPDPYWPRLFPSAKRGAILDASIDTVHDPIGVDLNVSPPVFIPHPDAANNYLQQAQDNVTSLDESGAVP